MAVITPASFPRLTTPRLLLRKLKPADDKAIFALRNNERVNEYINRPETVTLSDAQAFIAAINKGVDENGWLYWAIILKEDQKLIGTICYWHFSEENHTAETGYELHPDFQGFGYMQEALVRIIEYGFKELQLEGIAAVTDPNNKRSVKLLEKNNFVRLSETDQNATIEVKYLLTKGTK